MANSKNTNNSLTDLTNQGQGFNKSLSLQSNDENGFNNQTQSERERLENEILELERKYASANDNEKDEIASNIESKKRKISALDTLSEDELGEMTSLFDANSLIDYGRYLNADGTVTKDWKQYNSEDDVTFKNNSEITKKNEPVPYNDNTLDSDEGLSLPNLIEWSEKYPALQLKFQDFAYCKKLGYYPNNRLIVLRRFKSGVPDNLFDYVNTGSRVEFNQPLSTMITWWNPEEEIGDMKFSFNENWKSTSDGLMTTFKSAFANFAGISLENSGKNTASGINDLATSLLADALIKEKGLLREDGVPYTRSRVGNPNIVANAMKRVHSGDGLKSTISFSLKFEYEMRDINGIDPGIAMLDLISNCTRMGTSVSEFKYNLPDLKESVAFKALINGDINKALEVFKVSLKGLTDNISETFNSLISKLTGTNTQNNQSNEGDKSIIAKTSEYIISRYREDLKSALSVDSGLPSGIWHVSIGSPKSPIISCGDLVISNSILKLGSELGYNDFPNEFSITYTLDSARERGRDELNRIFNAGRGRVYVYPEAKYNPDYDLYSSDTPNNINDAKRNALNKNKNS